jgi:hypothetical protein
LILFEFSWKTMLSEEPGRCPLYLLNVLRHPSEVAGQWAMKRQEYNFPIYQFSFESKLFHNFEKEKK